MVEFNTFLIQKLLLIQFIFKNKNYHYSIPALISKLP